MAKQILSKGTGDVDVYPGCDYVEIRHYKRRSKQESVSHVSIYSPGYLINDIPVPNLGSVATVTTACVR